MKKETSNIEKSYILYRFPYTGEKEFLILRKKVTKIVTDEKIFEQHGKLIDTEWAGNGYHGRCSNCGLALETDLGFCNWENTICKIDRKETEIVEKKISWTSNTKKRSLLDKKDAHEIQSELMLQQG